MLHLSGAMGARLSVYQGQGPLYRGIFSDSEPEEEETKNEADTGDNGP